MLKKVNSIFNKKLIAAKYQAPLLVVSSPHIGTLQHRALGLSGAELKPFPLLQHFSGIIFMRHVYFEACFKPIKKTIILAQLELEHHIPKCHFLQRQGAGPRAIFGSRASYTQVSMPVASRSVKEPDHERFLDYISACRSRKFVTTAGPCQFLNSLLLFQYVSFLSKVKKYTTLKWQCLRFKQQQCLRIFWSKCSFIKVWQISL